MENKTSLLIIIALIIVASGVWYYEQKQNTPSQNTLEPAATLPQEIAATTTNETASSTAPNPNELPLPHHVAYTDSGFSPSTLTIKKGETVLWQNQTSKHKNMWVASAMHPTHRIYPETDIAKCGTKNAEGMFDECTGVSVKETWSFTFNETGTWKYHNHLNPSHFGSITVE